MLNGNVGVMVVGGLGVAFLGYCVYFDRKRRSAPDFRQKLIESKLIIKKKNLTKYKINF